MGGLQYGFVTWKQKTNKLRHRQILVKYLSRSIEANMCKTVWFRWQQTLILDNRKVLLQAINQKTVAIGNHKQKIAFQRQEIETRLSQVDVGKSEVTYEIA